MISDITYCMKYDIVIAEVLYSIIVHRGIKYGKISSKITNNISRYIFVIHLSQNAIWIIQPVLVSLPKGTCII